MLDSLVAERTASMRAGGVGDDVLSWLTESTEQEHDPAVARRRLRDELLALLPGNKTAASTLRWTLHLIDWYPEVTDRLHAEAVEILGD